MTKPSNQIAKKPSAKIVDKLSPLTESAAVEEAIRAVSDESDRPKAQSDIECFYFQKKASRELGYVEPYTAEQKAMNTILTKLSAGNNCCKKAWGLYHKLTSLPETA